jgi:hypothetical protein
MSAFVQLFNGQKAFMLWFVGFKADKQAHVYESRGQTNFLCIGSGTGGYQAVRHLHALPARQLCI